MAAPPRLAYSPDQARDERGRWTDEGGDGDSGMREGGEYTLTYTPVIGGRSQTNRVRYEGILDRGDGPRAWFVVLDDPQHPVGYGQAQKELYLTGGQVKELAPVEHEPVAHLTVRNYEGQVANRDHLTRVEIGTIPTRAIAGLQGVAGEQPGQHGARKRSGEDWEAFLDDVRANGITEPIFVTVDWGQPPMISEGNTRRDAAVELGLPEVPVEIRYFGHAEEDRPRNRGGTVAERAGIRVAAIVEWILPGGVRVAYSPDQARDERGRWTDEGGGGGTEDKVSDAEYARDVRVEWRDRLHEAFPNAKIAMDLHTQAMLTPESKSWADSLRAEGKGTTVDEYVAMKAAGDGAVDALVTLADDYPQQAEKIGSVYLGELATGTYGSFSMNSMLLSNEEEEIYGRWGNDERPLFRDSVMMIDVLQIGRIPLGLEGVDTLLAREPRTREALGEGVAVHEFGHVVDYAHGGLNVRNPLYDQAKTEELGDPPTPHISLYSLWSAPDYFAEAFTAERLGMGDRLTDEDRAMLRREGVALSAAATDGSVVKHEDTFVGSIIWEYAQRRGARVAFSEDQARDEYGRWVEEGGGAVVLTETREHGGITIRPVTGQEPDSGFIVATGTPSRIMTEDEFFADAERGIAAIEEFLTAHAEELSADPDLMLGTWLDREHHEVVLDVVEHVESRDEAVRLGQERDQQAIWDVVAGDEIGTGGSGGREASVEGHGVGEATEAGARHDSGGTARVRGADLPEDGGGTFVEVIEWMLPGGVRVAYSEEQAREPAGSPEGGRWVSTGEGDGEPTRYVYGEKGRVEEYIERNGPTDQADFLKWRAERQWTVPRTKEEFVDRRYEEMRAAFIEREQKGGFGSVLDYWSKGLDFDWEQEQVQAFIDGDPEAVAAIRESLEDHADRAEVDNVDWELQDQVQNAMYAVRDSDGLNAVFDKIGDLPSVYTAHMSPSPKDYAPEDMPTALTDWGGTIWLMDNYVAVGDPPPEPYGPSFPASSWTVREDTAGTIQHEIGHFVYGRMGRDDQASWERTYRSSDSLDVSRYAHEGDTGRRVGDDAPGLDAREGFAETFNAVMSRDYDASAYRDGAQPMLEWMVQFVGEENAGGGI